MLKHYFKLFLRVAWLLVALYFIWADPSGIALRVVSSVLIILVSLLMYQVRILAAKSDFKHNELMSRIKIHGTMSGRFQSDKPNYTEGPQTPKKKG